MAVLLREAQNQLGSQSHERERRLRDMAEHLLNTCESKNDMLARLFELVCYYEERMKDQDSAMQGINRMIEEGEEDNRRAWQARESDYRTQIYLLKEKLADIQGGGSGGSRHHPSGVPRPSSSSSSSRPSTAPGGASPSIQTVKPGGLHGQAPPSMMYAQQGTSAGSSPPPPPSQEGSGTRHKGIKSIFKPRS